ncbi:sigma-70 family RNA polymerase sigma factor [Methylosinus sp. Ce-a6]|uniref:sigma-70 family RNA polymerase sigma factor n=1 Tax=Methylosinus sp. Ce-a6 TaxID=2172005 RepID=UPI0013579226|nr:sigma-70 family RNA polymerase sigma factor [Methylosinus sp. Ce-a6]
MTSDDARHRFTRAIMPHLDDAYSLARWLTGNATDAEDVVQDACLRALAALESAEVAHPRAWLLAITRNVAFTWLAKNRPRDLVLAGGAEDAETHDGASPHCDEPSPEAALIEAADRRSVEAAIAALPIPFREALVMREVNGLSYREIADATGAPIGTVMSRLARARALLIDGLGRVSL